MNESMIEYDGLGITRFSVDILKTWLLFDMLEYLNLHVKTRRLL